MDSEGHPLNVESNKINTKRNLLKGGKINALLDQMEADATENAAQIDEAIRNLWHDHRTKGGPYPSEEVWNKRQEDLQIQKDAYALSRSIRKYAPFIETGAMTIAEAVSCEIQRTAGKPSEEKKK